MPASLTAYTIVAGDSDTSLIQQVNAHIKQGWKPIGGFVIATQPNAPAVFMQAMIR